VSLDPLSLQSVAIIILALAAGCFVKGITGWGLPLIAVPVLASFLGVEHAVAVMVVPGMAANFWLLWVHRARFATAGHLPPLLVAGMLGVVFGTWVLQALSERTLFLILAAAIGAYLLTLIIHPQFKVPRAADRYLSPVVGLLAGALQGATGISGPLVGTYYHALRLTQGEYVFGVTATFQVLFFTQALALSGFGMLDRVRLVEGLLAVLPIIVVLPLSVRVAQRISRRVFDTILITLIAVMGLRFLYKGLLGG